MTNKIVILLSCLSIALFASDGKMNEHFRYKHLCVNDSVSVYAGKVHLQNIANDEGYSVGLLLHKPKDAHTNFTLGYMQPAYQINALLASSSLAKTGIKREEGILFFMNHDF